VYHVPKYNQSRQEFVLRFLGFTGRRVPSVVVLWLWMRELLAAR
jgi:hypothetical protein